MTNETGQPPLGPHWTLDDDLRAVTVTFPLKTLTLNADQVQEVLDNLGRLRSLMLPELPLAWPSGAVKALEDPRWFTEPEMMEGNSLLHIRDPRFGWLHYMLPREEARKLGETLIAQADSPRSGPAPGRAN